jgi:hypothetical protein
VVAEIDGAIACANGFRVLRVSFYTSLSPGVLVRNVTALRVKFHSLYAAVVAVF